MAWRCFATHGGARNAASAVASQEALGRFIEQAIPRDRQMATARQLGRLDELISDYWPLAKSGNYKALREVIKMISHQCALLGIFQPHTANANTIALQVNALERPPSGTDKIEKALERLLQDQRREEAQAVVEADAAPAEAPAAEH